ncbi:MAG: M23 family metallopeptidase [Bacteroidia bacterium]|nr:M23 family metallopeptidase [Bacteroidia bacterium]
MNKLSFLYVYLFFTLCVQAQVKPSLIWPLDSPRVLTGNFGELRPNHFHTGLDFSTNGKENLQVYAIEEGYVSRIRVSPYGYGKALYITHANGKVSVYAHLNTFSLKIDKALKQEQYAKQSFEVDFYPKPWSLFVRKNEIIALSGNTGGSSGPHLHFELRDEKTEITINPLSIYHVQDNILPVLQQLAFYDLSDSLQPALIRNVKTEDINLSADTLDLPGSLIGIAFEAYDQYLKKGNHNNVYETKVFLDNKLIYHHRLNEMDFADFRYVNEFCDYRNHSKFQKCFLPALYPHYLYPETQNKGRIILRDSKSHTLRLVLADESGNQTELSTFLRATVMKEYKSPNNTGDDFMHCNRDTSLHVKQLSLHFPNQSLYNDVALFIETTSDGKEFVLGPSYVNFRSAFYIGLKFSGREQDKQQTVLKTDQSVLVPEIRKDTLWFACKNLGTFKQMIDSIPPSVKTVLASKKRQPKSVRSRLEFFLSDKLSGIGQYALYVNEQWVIAEYDAKSHCLSYVFEEQSPTGEVRLRLVLTDKVGNRLEQHYSIKR